MSNANVRTFFAEMLGTFIFIGTIITVINQKEASLNFLKIGIALMVAIVFLGPISGGAFNPAVSLMLYLNNKVDLTGMYSQIVGQLAGLALIFLVYNNLHAKVK
tara:strand:- start:10348 stop:10659 length:312 start_codon:yes stop_codon:yes gene_type:complete